MREEFNNSRNDIYTFALEGIFIGFLYRINDCFCPRSLLMHVHAPTVSARVPLLLHTCIYNFRSELLYILSISQKQNSTSKNNETKDNKYHQKSNPTA